MYNIIQEKKTSRTKSNDWLYNAVHDLIEGIYANTENADERILMMGNGYEAFKELDYWLRHA